MGFESKFESKGSKYLGFRAYSVYKDFDKKIFIFCAMLPPKITINFERNDLEA